MVSITTSLQEKGRTTETGRAAISPYSSGRCEARFGVMGSGVSFRGVVYGGSGYAQENLMVVMALAKAGIAVGIEPQMQQSDIENLLPQETRSALEFFKLQPVDL